MSGTSKKSSVSTSQEEGRKGSLSSSQDEEKGKDFCPKCKCEVKSEDKATVCDTCGNWFHIQCIKISVKQYDLMKKEELKFMHWFCSGCEESTINTGKTLYSLTVKQEKLEAEISKFKDEMNKELGDIKQDYTTITKGLSDEISKLRKTVTDMKSVQECQALTLTGVKEVVDSQTKMVDNEIMALVDKKIEDYDVRQVDKIKLQEPLWTEVVTKQVKKTFEDVTVNITEVQKVVEETKLKALEEKDKELRAKNVIIYRVPECVSREELQTQDKKFCLDLFHDILETDCAENDIVKCFRLGKKGTINRPLLIQFREKAQKNCVMESLSKLKNASDKFRNISITHDMTKQEREVCKKLVEEAKDRQSKESGEFLYRVRGVPGMMKVIKISKRQQ